MDVDSLYKKVRQDNSALIAREKELLKKLEPRRRYHGSKLKGIELFSPGHPRQINIPVYLYRKKPASSPLMQFVSIPSTVSSS